MLTERAGTNHKDSTVANSTKMSFPMVMESQPATCDVFGGSTFCDEFSSGTAGNIRVDQPITSTIATFLSDCILRTPGSCEALDIGANMGAMTSSMLATGAQVTAIEPQTDLSQLVWATACLNGWSERLSMYNNAVTTVQKEAGTLLQLGNKDKAGTWGFRPDRSHLSADADTKSAKKVFIDQVVGSTQSYAVVKIDTDSVDDEVTRSFLAMLDAGKLSVTTFMVEEPSPELCHGMQERHGYSMYITQNPHTGFTPQLQWIQAGLVTQFTVKLKFPSAVTVTVWKIAPNLSEMTWRALLSKNVIRVINMLMTKTPDVIDSVSSPADNAATLLAARASAAEPDSASFKLWPPLPPWPVRAGNTPPPPFKYYRSSIDSVAPLPAIFVDGALRDAPFAANEVAAADFGACRHFEVNNGKLYRGIMPDGTRAPGQVYLRCNGGYVLAAGMNPERICAAELSTGNRDELMSAMDDGTLIQAEDGKSRIRAARPGMVAKWIPGDALGRWYGQQEMCVRQPVARLSRTQSSGTQRSRKCFEDLLASAASQPDLRPANMKTMKKFTLFGKEHSMGQEQEVSLFGRGSGSQQSPSSEFSGKASGQSSILGRVRDSVQGKFPEKYREYQQRHANKFADTDAISKGPPTSAGSKFQDVAQEMKLIKACMDGGVDASDCHAAFHDNNPKGNRRQLQPGDGYNQQLPQVRAGAPLGWSARKPSTVATNPSWSEWQNENGVRDYRSQALQCLGCRARPGNVMLDCSKDGRLFELGGLKCSEKEELGLIDGGEYCITKATAAAGDDPCTILTIGVGYIWSVEQDLAHRWNCTVYMFDPTPTSGLGTVPPTNRIYKMQYDASKRTRPFGIWMDHIGIAADSKQAPMVNSQQFGNDKVSDVSFLTVDEILERIGHQDGSKIALLKLDVEGYEFEVDAAGKTTVFEQVLDQRFPCVASRRIVKTCAHLVATIVAVLLSRRCGANRFQLLLTAQIYQRRFPYLGPFETSASHGSHRGKRLPRRDR